MNIRVFTVAAALAAIAGLAFPAENTEPKSFSARKAFDPDKGSHKSGNSTQILYHGGPVMNVSNSVYVIYYGTGFAPTTQAIIDDFLFGLNGSAQYSVNGTYNAGGNTPGIPPTYSFTPPSTTTGSGPSGSVYQDSGSQGTQLGTSSIPNIVAHALQNGLPYNANGVYLVVTSPNVKIAGFCKDYCAYHTDANVNGSGGEAHVRYALIPDPTQRCSACNGGVAVYGDKTTPNGDFGADTMTDDIIHELSESVTDPDLNAWYTKSGDENGDLCDYVYGPTYTGVSSTGATYHYNAMLQTISGRGSRPYLIQQIWKNSGAGFCASN